jgi:hypothetical protein
VKLRQVINQELKDYLGQKGVPAANHQAKEFIKGLKDNLSGDTISLNANKLGEGAGKEFSKAWDKANKSHSDLQEFYKAPQPSGRVAPLRSQREALQADGDLDSAVIGKYMPKPSQTGTSGLNQLARLFGSKQAAQDAAKSYINRKPLTNGNAALDTAAEYGKLSPAQREWIYGGSKEGKLLDTVNTVRTEIGKEPWRQFYKMFSHVGVPAALFGTLGYHAGEGTGAATGIAAPIALSLLASRAGGKLSPETVQKLLRYSQTPTPNRGRNVNALFQSLSQGGQQ